MTTIYIPSTKGNYVTQDQLLGYSTINSLNSGLAGKLNTTSNIYVQGATGVFGNMSGANNITTRALLCTGTGIFTNFTASTGSVTNDFTVSGTLYSQRINSANRVKIGDVNCALTNQGYAAVAIGINAGNLNQGQDAIGIGSNSSISSGLFSVAIGTNSGSTSGINSTCVGYQAGYSGLGNNSVCLGANAGQFNFPADSICINAQTAVLNPSTAGVFISSIAGRTGTGKVVNSLHYDATTKEIWYVIS